MYWVNPSSGEAQWETPEDVLKFAEKALPPPVDPVNKEELRAQQDQLRRANALEDWQGFEFKSLPATLVDRLRMLEATWMDYKDRNLHINFLYQHIEIFL